MTPSRRQGDPVCAHRIYDVWKGDGGRAVTSFAIVTIGCAARPTRRRRWWSPTSARSRRGKLGRGRQREEQPAGAGWGQSSSL